MPKSTRFWCMNECGSFISLFSNSVDSDDWNLFPGASVTNAFDIECHGLRAHSSSTIKEMVHRVIVVVEAIGWVSSRSRPPRRRSPAWRRALLFFDARSFSTELSSIASARNLFSRAFSSSSNRSRRVPDTSSHRTSTFTCIS